LILSAPSNYDVIVKKIREKRQIALVLSGGGIKAAAFHIGVCMALHEKGFRFRGGMRTEGERPDPVAKFPLEIATFVGSSAGAIISSILASGYSISDLLHAFEIETGTKKAMRGFNTPSGLRKITYFDIFSINRNGLFRLVPDFMRRKSLVSGGIEALLKYGFKVNGLFTTRGIERYLREAVLPTNDFHLLDCALYIVATQLNHSRKAIFGPYDEYVKKDDIKLVNWASISESVAASASLPPVFSPYGIRNPKGKTIYFFDGEIRDTLSTHAATDSGADLVIASYSIQPYHFNSVIGSLHRFGIPIIANQALYQVVEQKIKRHIQHQGDIRATINIVEGYCRENDIADEHRTRLVDALSKRLNYRAAVDYMYIHPHPQDYDFFFADHFSLNGNILNKIVMSGFKSALRTLRRYNF